MTDQPNDGEPNPESADDSDSGPKSQEIRHSQVSALVPEHVAGGTFSTGAVVLQGAHEFIIDFLIRMQQPQQVAARVVLPHSVVPQFLQALRDNLGKYQERFGEIKPPVDKQQPQQQPPPADKNSAQDLYDQLKLPETVMSGDYANAVMIGHTANEFSFDFITTFFPKSAVARRVYLSAATVPRFADSLQHSFNQFQQQQQQKKNPPDIGTENFGD